MVSRLVGNSRPGVLEQHSEKGQYIDVRDTVPSSVSHENQTEPVPTNEKTAPPACVRIGRETAGYHPEDQSQTHNFRSKSVNFHSIAWVLTYVHQKTSNISLSRRTSCALLLLLLLIIDESAERPKLLLILY
jgi:hypothetical protein